MGLHIHREWAMPNSDTFDVPPIAAFVRKYLYQSKVSIDPFSRNKRWATFTNDINPETQAESHMDAEEFICQLADSGIVADLVVIDPPYSPRQAKECYESAGLKMQYKDTLLGAVRGKLREEINRVLSADGVALWFGWNSTGMGVRYGFAIEEILLVCHGSDHNDTICLAERRIQQQLSF